MTECPQSHAMPPPEEEEEARREGQLGRTTQTVSCDQLLIHLQQRFSCRWFLSSNPAEEYLYRNSFL